jgi:hypothetical protein
MRFALLLCFSVALAGCGGDDGAFAGTWNCTTTLTDSIVGSYTYSDTLIGVDLGNDEITLHESTDECAPVKLKVSGHTATLVSGQSCHVSDGTIVSYVSWTATSDGKTLTMDYHDQSQVTAGERQYACTR